MKGHPVFIAQHATACCCRSCLEKWHNVPAGKAKAIVKLASDAGLKLTPAGATFPYGVDPADSNIRIAPTFPTLAELEDALVLFDICVRLACAEG